MSEKAETERYQELFVDEHITLRAVTEQEAGDLFSVTDGNREYLAEYLPWVDSTNNVSDSLIFIQNTKTERAEGSQFGFGIYYDNQLVGHISLMHITDGNSPEIGYWIAKNYSGKGVTTKAAQAVTEFGFAVLGVDHIVIKAREDNTPSNAIPPKIGYELHRVERGEDEVVNVWRKNNDK